MELLQKPIKPLYFKYLAAAFGSALVGAIYTLADMAIVGQYEGPNGTAAMAIVLPIWSMICSLGIMTGIGGSVLYSAAKGKEGGKEEANAFFTASVTLSVILAIFVWIALIFFDRQILSLFGAKEELLHLALNYLKPLKVVIPFCLFNQMLAAFLRNDGDPTLATIAVVSTAVLNIIGDYVLTFTLDMGIFGAALATSICNVMSVLIMLFHFKKRTNTLRLVKTKKLIQKYGSIIATGFSTFFVDIAMGIMNVLFNHQVLRYFGNDALSVYGAIASLCTVVSCCSYSIGQAAQPIISINYGAGQGERIQKTMKYAICTAIAFGVFWSAILTAFPNDVIKIFMSATDSVLAIAPGIMRRYCIGFLLTPMNLFSTYYFQSLMKATTSFVTSVLRGLVISGVFIFVLPAMLNKNALWFAMPLTELIICVLVVVLMIKTGKNLTKNGGENYV